MNNKKRFLSSILIICLIGLFLPAQVTAGECVVFIEENDYNNTLRTDSMVAYGIAGYIVFRYNNSKVPFHNATITNAYTNLQANGSIHMDIYRTYLSENISQIAYELMTEIDLITQPGVGLNTSIVMPYLNGQILFGGSIYLWVPSIVVLMTNLENYTISLDMVILTYWDVYFVDDDNIWITDETEIIETTESSVNETETLTTAITPIITNESDVVSIWTIVMSALVGGEIGVMAILVRLIILKRRKIYSEN